MTAIGIMQGRLSPPHPGRLQAFPWSTWEQEFDRAASLGLDAIEWVAEAERIEDNPLLTGDGRRRIRTLIQRSGVAVASVCADVLMPRPFVRVSDSERRASVERLMELVGAARAVGAATVLVPVLEQSEVRTAAERSELAASLQEPLALARSLEMRIGLETELPVGEYLGLLDQINHESAAAYYDLGNAAAKGYDTAADLRAIGKRLCGVHVKDRVRGGSSVRLGEGAVDFPAAFAALGDIGYRGPVILQTAFGPDFLKDAAAHLEFVRRHWSASGEPAGAAA